MTETKSKEQIRKEYEKQALSVEGYGKDYPNYFTSDTLIVDIAYRIEKIEETLKELTNDKTN